MGSREGGIAALLDLLHELLQRIVHGLQRARQSLVVEAGLIARRHEVAMHGIEALLARRLRSGA